MDDKSPEIEAMTLSPSTSSMAARKKRKVSFAPSPLSSEDSVSMSSPSKDHSPSRRSARLSRLKETSENPNVPKSMVDGKAGTSMEVPKTIKESLDSRITRSRSAIVSSQQEGQNQNSDDESMCSSISTVSSITSSCSYLSGGNELVKRKPGRPPGAKNKKGPKKGSEMALDKESLAIAAEFLKKYPIEAPIAGKRRRRRKPAEVREGTAQGNYVYTL